MLLKNLIFIIINFLVSFMSDIILNDLSTNYGIVSSLKPYFYKQPIIKTACVAGITIVLALILTMAASNLLLGFSVPSNYRNLLYFSLLAFALGFIIDILIYKMNIFGNRLTLYYKEEGAGFWGATAFIFSIIISYFIQKNVICIY